MSPDQDDPLWREIHTLEDAKRLVMEHAMGMHCYRMSYGGDRHAATFTDVFAPKGTRAKPMDIALRTIRREVLWKYVTIGTRSWGGAYIVLFTENNYPLPPEEFGPNELQRFCLRVMELCAAWEGVDDHLDR